MHLMEAKFQLACELPIGRFDLFERVFRIVNKIHLVDRNNHMPNAEQRRDIGVAPRLGEDALARIDQNNRNIRRRRTRRHIARILFMAWRVRDDELALIRREKAIGNINRDALLTFCGKTVHKKGEIKIIALSAELLTVRFKRRELIFENQF